MDEYVSVIEWVRGQGVRERGVDPDLVFGGGDSAGGNMTAAVSLRLRDEGRKGLAGAFLLYPEARVYIQRCRLEFLPSRKESDIRSRIHLLYRLYTRLRGSR